MGGIRKVSGITSQTYNQLLHDSGVIYADRGLPAERILGVTRGGNNFTVEDDNRKMGVDGAPGTVKGSIRRVASNPKLTVNFVTITTEILKMALPGATDVEIATTYDKITRNQQISIDDYFDNITLVVGKGGTDGLVEFKAMNAIALNGFDIATADDDESVVTVEFEACFDPENLEDEPWEIRNPLEVELITHTLNYAADAEGSIIGNSSQVVADGENGVEVYASVTDPGSFVFDQWSDASTDNPRQDLAVASDLFVTASFVAV